jgi:hypothetical protein
MMSGRIKFLFAVSFTKKRMKFSIIVLLLLGTTTINAQPVLLPGKKAVEKKWIKDEQYQMAWYALKDTVRIEMGKVNTEIITGKKQLLVITRVSMKQMKAPWTDSTIADSKTMAPVYHSSYNMQRDMVLNFGNPVTGYYNDKMKNKRTVISDTVNGAYFDSNLYPTLIRWLPFKEGYTKDLPIYDYNPAGKKGILKASITYVKKGIYHSAVSGDHPVWIVTVSDEIGGGENGVSDYFIDIADRKLWKQEINAGGRRMLMECIEN